MKHLKIAKLNKIIKGRYVKGIILGVGLLLSLTGFWFGLRVILKTEYPLLAISSESMQPALNVGDLVIIQGVTNSSEINAAPKPDGDVIAFRKPMSSNEIIVHRVISKVLKNDMWYFRTMGDNSTTPDWWEGEGTWSGMVSEKNFIGKVICRVPLLGYFSLFLHTPTGMFIAAILLFVVIIIEYFPWKKPPKLRIRR